MNCVPADERESMESKLRATTMALEHFRAALEAENNLTTVF